MTLQGLLSWVSSMPSRRFTASLALRTAIAAALFGLITSSGAILVGCLALSYQLDARSLVELQGKRDLLSHALSEVNAVEEIGQDNHRFVDLLIGHGDLHLALVDVDKSQVVASFSTLADQSVSALKNAANNDATMHPWVSNTGLRLNSFKGTSTLRNGQEVRFYLSLDRARDTGLLHDFIKATLSGLPVLLLVIALGTWLITKTGLAPLHRFHRLAASVGAQSLSGRMSSSGLPAELSELATEFNLMLERVDEGYQRLQEFSGNLAHEMRTPVSTLLGRSQVALSQNRSVEQLREVIEGNIEELERLARLIADMLFLAKAEHIEDQFDRVSVDLGKICQKIAAYLSLVAEERNLEIKVEGAATLIAAPLLVERAISNLLTNAIRHAHENSRVSMTIESHEQLITVTVANFGERIDSENLERIFDRFYRIDSARTRLDGGNGLGLAIVRSIMTSHGGTVAVTSSAGKTVFLLSFPGGFA